MIMQKNKEMKNRNNTDIVVKIMKCLLAYYSVYYSVASLCYGAFDLTYSGPFDVRMPFDFARFPNYLLCCDDYSPVELAHLSSVYATYALVTCIFPILTGGSLWDYHLTVTSAHVLISALVRLEFPTNWSWYVSLALGTLFSITVGELLLVCARCDRTRRMRE